MNKSITEKVLKTLTDNLIVAIPVITAILFTIASWLSTRVDVPMWLTATTTAIAFLVGQVVVPFRFSKPIHQMRAKGMTKLSDSLNKLKLRYHATEVLQIAIILTVLLLSWFTETSSNILITINFLGVAFLMVVVGIIAFTGDGIVATFEGALDEVKEERTSLRNDIESYRAELKEKGMNVVDIEHTLYFRFGSDYRNTAPSGHRKWLQNNMEEEKPQTNSMKELLVNGVNILSLPKSDRKNYFQDTVVAYGDNLSTSELANVFEVSERTYFRWLKELPEAQENNTPKKIGF